MDNYNSGIETLFAYYYQIKTFVSLLAKISDGQIIGYEYIDDVSVYDDEESSYNLKSDGNIKLFQVKKTNVDRNTAKKVLYNWLLSDDADHYFLIVSTGYNCDDSIIKETDAAELYDLLCATKGLSLDTKMFDKYKKHDNKDSFLNKIKYVRDRYELLPDYDCDYEILENFKKYFHYNGDGCLYNKRIKMFLERITALILESVQNKKPYLISFAEMNEIVEDVCNHISEDKYEIDYDLFCDSHKVSLDDKKIIESREYIQLKYCNLPDSTILNRLKDELYYLDFQMYWLERNRTTKISNIERTAVANFEDACLEVRKNDLPEERYVATIRKEISNTNNKMQSNGVYISLTKDSDKRISWKKDE